MVIFVPNKLGVRNEVSSLSRIDFIVLLDSGIDDFT
jgi:hypothetical protein